MSSIFLIFIVFFKVKHIVNFLQSLLQFIVSKKHLRNRSNVKFRQQLYFGILKSYKK